MAKRHGEMPARAWRRDMEVTMNSTDISFPNLNIYLHNVPQSFYIFGLEIRLYGLIIGIGIMCGLLVAVQIAKKTKQDPELYWDFVIYAVIFSVIGARIYYVVFEWKYYKDDLLSILNLRNGGLAIYGGVIAAFITIFVYCKIKKKNPYLLGDTAVPGLILGQAIGRWGNFTNREVFGGYTDNLFAMRLPIAAVRARDIPEELAATVGAGENFIQVHPTFLYESVWNLFVFALLLFWTKRKKFDGEICLLYFAGYGVGRFIIEGIRTDTLFIPGTAVPVSQALSLVMVVFSVVTDGIVRVRSGRKKDL